jgi:hypothetical protein
MRANKQHTFASTCAALVQVFYPMSGIFAAAKALQDIYHGLGEDGSTSAHLDSLMSFDHFRRVIGYAEKVALEEKYSRGEAGDKLVVRVPGRSRPSEKAASIAVSVGNNAAT